MKRWVVVFALVAFVAALLMGVRSFRGQPGPTDELLVYEATPARSVQTPVPADTYRVVLTTWLLVDPQPFHDPARVYPYSVTVDVLDHAGHLTGSQRVDNLTRISGDPNLPIERGEFAARPADGADWATDPRSTVVDVSRLAGGRGLLRVRALGKPDTRVLVRLAYAEPRSELERDVVERTLDSERRRALVERRSSLGFGDLPPQARQRVLATWGRRLTALGRNGRDFVNRRLLVGGYRADLRDVEQPNSVAIGPHRRAALNFEGAVSLWISAPPRSVLHVLDRAAPDQDPSSLLVGDSGRISIPLEGTLARTVDIWSERPRSVRFDLPAAMGDQILGQGASVVWGQRIATVPDAKLQRYYRLADDEPIRYSVLPGQRRIGITVRAELDTARQAQGWAKLAVEWRGAAEAVESFTEQLRLERSDYEVAGDASVTDRRTVLLRPPEGATELRIMGSQSTLVSVWTDEPGVDEDRIAPEYDAPLEEGYVWRYAAYDQRTIAVLRPDGDDGSQMVGVTVQARIEPLTSRGKAIVARPLLPRGLPISRQLLRPIWYGARGAFPPPYWTPLRDGTSRLHVASNGPRGRRMILQYRADEERLGQDLVVELDGRQVLDQRLIARRAQVRIAAPAGVHTLVLRGLGATGLALVDSAPAGGAEVVRRQTVYEVTSKRDAMFDLERRPGEILALMVEVATEDGPAPFRVSFQIDDGDVDAVRGRFFTRMTTFEGTLTGRTGGEHAVFWEVETRGSERWPVGLGQARIQLGDDLGVGRHRIALRALDAGRSYWIRLVTVGRVAQEGLVQ